MIQDKHRKILGNLYFGLGVVALVFVILTWINHPDSADQIENSRLYISILISVSVFITCGLALLSNTQFAHWICIPVSILLLFGFPVGTAVGGYCLWYFWRFGLNAK